YCVVPYARGREVYRGAEAILNEVKNLVGQGYKEIILIAQNVNSYKCNVNTANDTRMPRIFKNTNNVIEFHNLLRAINNIQGDFWVRFVSSHPKDMSDDLILAIAECEKVCKHIHLPAQSGDNEILKSMNRKYKIEHYLDLIKKIKNNIKSELPAAITTDIIVGFPGETKKQFNNTIKLFKKVKYDMAYIARYSPRYGTTAEKMKDDVKPNEKKRREEELMKILKKTALENNQRYLGKTVKVLVEGLNKKGFLFGKTETSKIVKFLGDKDFVGKFACVKITKTKDFGLSGVLEKNH
ncbi:MiaB/RimO family radical SAM methylthiotransferase, partial [Candidatus Parcubacteria bacterium]|nr:MiaB/RimO family radical SAM methylthiotransferase [Candidatus Parcubacteria bacterium]